MMFILLYTRNIKTANAINIPISPIFMIFLHFYIELVDLPPLIPLSVASMIIWPDIRRPQGLLRL